MVPKKDIFLHRFAVSVAFSTAVLLCAGALVTSTGSGLAVPDWPLSYGRFFPPMIGGILFEHGHRLVAGFVATLTIIQAFLLLLWEKRKPIRNLAVASVIVVLMQAALGGLTVLLRLPPQVSIVHACLAQIFFCTVVVLALSTSRLWKVCERNITYSGTGVSLPVLAVSLSGFLFLQLLAGATMRHFGAGLAIPDFPSAFGGVLPPQWPFPVLIHFVHRTGAFFLIFFTTYVVCRVNKEIPHVLVLVTSSGLILALLFFQMLLGAFVIWTGRSVPLTVIHLLVGALTLASSIIFSSLVLRMKNLQENRSGSLSRLDLAHL